MLIIQIITPESVKTIRVDVATEETIMYTPCLYCGEVLVRFPRKYCCNSHKVLTCLYREHNPDFNASR